MDDGPSPLPVPQPDTDLPLDTDVIRGGVNMSPEVLGGAFQDHYDFYHDAETGECRGPEPHYCYALSVNSIPALSVDDVARRAKRPNAELRPTTPALVVGAGFSIMTTPGRQESDGHCDVFLPVDGGRLPTPEELVKLEQAFGPRQRNEGSPKRR